MKVGKNTKGEIFVVSIVVTEQERDELLKLCEQLEYLSGKHKDKWGKANHEQRMRFLRHIFSENRFRECLRYEVFYQTTDYDTATIEGIVAAIKWKSQAISLLL